MVELAHAWHCSRRPRIATLPNRARSDCLTPSAYRKPVAARMTTQGVYIDPELPGNYHMPHPRNHRIRLARQAIVFSILESRISVFLLALLHGSMAASIHRIRLPGDVIEHSVQNHHLQFITAFAFRIRISPRHAIRSSAP